MPDWLFDRSTVIALAIAGGVFSILASLASAQGWANPQQYKMLNRAAYVCMAVSMILFIGAGLFGLGGQAQ